MDILKIQDLSPQETEFTINGKIYQLREMNLEDWSWLKKRTGDSFSSKLNTGFQIDELAVIILRLLKDKTPFIPKQETDYDDDGAPFERTVTGPQQLLREWKGLSSFNIIAEAFSKAMGLPLDVIDAATKDLQKTEGPKKKE